MDRSIVISHRHTKACTSNSYLDQLLVQTKYVRAHYAKERYILEHKTNDYVNRFLRYQILFM